MRLYTFEFGWWVRVSPVRKSGVCAAKPSGLYSSAGRGSASIRYGLREVRGEGGTVEAPASICVL